MLPRKLSNNICSLNPHVLRYTICCDIDFTDKGIPESYDIYPAIIESKGRLTYKKVNEVYLLDASFMVEAYRKNDRKSLRYETIKEKGHLIRQGFLPRLHYLEIIDQYYCEVFK